MTINKKRIRRDLAQQQDGKCFWCGKAMHQPTLDHIIPSSLGGQNDPGNIVASCQKCNGAKGNAMPDAYLHKKMKEIHTFMQSDGFKRFVLGKTA